MTAISQPRLGVTTGEVRSITWQAADGWQHPGLSRAAARRESRRPAPASRDDRARRPDRGRPLRLPGTAAGRACSPTRASRSSSRTTAARRVGASSSRNPTSATWAAQDWADIQAGIDRLIADGIADPDRLGICGWSYGGYMTAWAVGQTTRFKAAMAGASITDWRSFHGRSYLHTWDRKHYGDSDPYDPASNHARFNPFANVQAVTTPTLFLHGELDWDVPVEQAYFMYPGAEGSRRRDAAGGLPARAARLQRVRAQGRPHHAPARLDGRAADHPTRGDGCGRRTGRYAGRPADQPHGADPLTLRPGAGNPPQREAVDAVSRSVRRRSSSRPRSRRRSCWDSIRLRRRIDRGVTSTSSSPAMNSIADFSVIRPWRGQPQGLVVRMGPDVRELLFLGRVDVHVAGTAVLADDHALVDLDAGADEQFRPILEVEQAVRNTVTKIISGSAFKTSSHSTTVDGSQTFPEFPFPRRNPRVQASSAPSSTRGPAIQDRKRTVVQSSNWRTFL